MPSLAEFVRSGSFIPGTLVCSTDKFRGKRFKKGQERAEIVWRPTTSGFRNVKVQFSIEHICSSTLKDRLQTKNIVAHVSRFVGEDNDFLILEPFVIGAPWLLSFAPDPEGKLMWHHYDYFELFIEDVDEFAAVKHNNDESSDWKEHMRDISEAVVKKFITGLIGDEAGKDWGGELADHFSRHIHVNGRRHTAAILLKGPGSKFVPMTVKQLGDNGDQIFRLSKLPADLYILQHCHEVTPAVLETLRNAIVQPHRKRRYLVIDGRDSYKLLKAYGKLEWAKEESKKEKKARKKRHRKNPK